MSQPVFFSPKQTPKQSLSEFAVCPTVKPRRQSHQRCLRCRPRSHPPPQLRCRRSCSPVTIDYQHPLRSLDGCSSSDDSSRRVQERSLLRTRSGSPSPREDSRRRRHRRSGRRDRHWWEVHRRCHLSPRSCLRRRSSRSTGHNGRRFPPARRFAMWCSHSP